MKKILFFVGSLFILNGCLQSTAMVGPSLSLAGGGNVYQAGFSYGAGKLVEKETGMSTAEYITSILEKEKKILEEENKINKIKEKKFKEDLYTLVLSNLKKTEQQNNLISMIKLHYEETKKELKSNFNSN